MGHTARLSGVWPQCGCSLAVRLLRVLAKWEVAKLLQNQSAGCVTRASASTVDHTQALPLFREKVHLETARRHDPFSASCGRCGVHNQSVVHHPTPGQHPTASSFSSWPRRSILCFLVDISGRAGREACLEVPDRSEPCDVDRVCKLGEIRSRQTSGRHQAIKREGRLTLIRAGMSRLSGSL